MKLVQAVKLLRKSAGVVVIGPPRSGTRIISKILASELDFEYIDERLFGMIQWNQFLKFAVERTVTHAPALTELAQEMPLHLHVVYVCRNTEDIRKSRERIKWPGEARERQRIEKRFGPTKGDILDATKDIWLKIQQPALGDRGLTVTYESAAEHKSFVPKSERGNFSWWQTERK